MNARDPALAVVHLVRRANDIGPFKSFIESYRHHPAGAPHQLVLVFKGFDGEASTEPYRSYVSELDVRSLHVADDGFDLGSYQRAAHALPHSRVLFLNSFSVILSDDWLALLTACADEPRIGAVAASGSWGSRASHDRYELGLRGPYNGVFADRRVTHEVFARLTSATPTAQQPAGRLRPLLAAARSVLVSSVVFPAFPAPHLRSNCVLIDRDLWLEVCGPPPRGKFAAYRIESGRRSITNRITRMGLRTVVVGRDGHAYDVPDWPASRTFWQASQENLLVADNQTDSYLQGDATTRRVLAGYAWGPEANPA
jgi:hypothetical protein